MKTFKYICISIISIFFSLLFAALFFTVYASAENIAASDYGAGDIINALPEDVANELEQRGISPENGGALGLSAGDTLGYIWELFLNEITAPLRLLLMITGVILLSALAEALRDSSNNSANETFRLVGVICCAGMMAGYIAACITRSGNVLNASGTFFNIFIPIFAGILAVSGKIASASVLCGVIIAAAQLITQLMVMFIMPVCTSLFGISIAGAINPDLRVEKIGEAVKKIVTWLLGITVAVFIGLLSIQSFIAGAADSVTLRAVKFAVSNSVPIIGGAVSDALATVKGSIGLVQSTTGTFGIIALAVIMLPPIISVICYRLVLSVAGAVSEMFGADSLTKLIKSGENILSIVFAMLAAFMMLSIISTALMLMIHNNNAV